MLNAPQNSLRVTGGELMNKRRIVASAVAAAAMVGVSVAPASPASASVACRSSANLKQINGTDDNGHWPGYSYAVTTANCYDIQVKLTTSDHVTTCFQPSSGSYYCNDGHDVPANTWTLAATNVKDGTKFWLLFWSTEVHGVAAY